MAVDNAAHARPRQHSRRSGSGNPKIPPGRCWQIKVRAPALALPMTGLRLGLKSGMENWVGTEFVFITSAPQFLQSGTVGGCHDAHAVGRQSHPEGTQKILEFLNYVSIQK